MSDYSDQEIDLRPYIEALLDKWYWIVGAGIVAALLGVAISLLQPQTYEATALVAVTEARQRVQFDPRIQTVDESQPLNAYPDLALSDDLLGELMAQFPEEDEISLSDLRKLVSAAPGGDPSILKLTVSNSNPRMAADLANTWAELFVSWANQVYGDQGDEQLLFFEAQLNEAAGKLETAEQNLIGFQAINRSDILDNELLALSETQADYLAKQRQIDLILQDIESLIGAEGSEGLGDQAGVDQLTSVLLRLRALGGVSGSTDATVPYQIQVNLDGQADLTPEEERTIITSLQQSLRAQSAQLEQSLADLEPQLLTVQQQKEEANVEQDRLVRDMEVAQETYTTLARAVDEKRITSQNTTSGVRLASKTAVPENPAGPRKAFIVIGAGLLGAMLAAGVIVVMTWWRAQSGGAETNRESE